MVRQERLSGQPQTGAAGAPVAGCAGPSGVGAITADKPPVLVGDHRPEIRPRHAVGAANGQDCVRRHWALPCHDQTV